MFVESKMPLRSLVRRSLEGMPGGRRFVAAYRAWNGTNGPKPLPYYHPDALREEWRRGYGASEPFHQVLGSMGHEAWPPKMDRYMVLDGLLRSALALPGDLAECGVYKGGTARLIAGTRTASGVRKRLFLLDTFKGMPEPTAGLDSTWRAGDLGDVDIEEVKQFLVDLPDIVFLPGLFSDTLLQLAESKFCFVHVDADLYTSVRECCEFFWPRMVNGGVVVFDDYGFPNCPGAKKAIDEYFARIAEKPVYLPTAQAFAVKHSTNG